MQYIQHSLKEAAEVVVRSVRRHVTGQPPSALIPLLDEMRTYGYVTIEDFWSHDKCARAVTELELALRDHSTGSHWTDAIFSDHRVYCAEKFGGVLEEYFQNPFIENVRRHYSGVQRAARCLLGARLDCVEGNTGSGDGWHRDSPHRSQFKAILYLSDVEFGNGPFEYLEGTHRPSQSLRLLRDGLTRPNQYRFAEVEVERMLSAGVPRRTLAASAGTLIFVDTKGIHRGRPIDRGSRYALTQYCFDGPRPPSHFPPSNGS